ncbi:MAG: CBS domain-containing protein [Brevinematales bacterium]
MNELDEVKVGVIGRKVPFTVTEDMPITKAADKMLREKVHSLIVIDAKGKPVGILDSWDVMKVTFMGESGKDMPVSKVLDKKKFFFVYEEVSLRDALNLMLDKGVRSLPVLDENDKLIGKISLTDIAQFVREKL